MRILFLVKKDTYDTKMSRVRFHQIDAIAEKLRNGLDVPRERLRISGPGWPGWNNDLSPSRNIANLGIDEQVADLVITYDVPTPESPIPVCVQYNEADDHEKVERFVYENAVRLVVFHHENDRTRYRYQFETRAGIMTTHIPHCVNTAIYRDYGLPKDVDVLVAGNLSQFYYPFRHRLMLLATKQLAKRGYKVVVLQHPGYTLPPRESTVVGEDFARMINRSKITLTCSMRFNYALAKYSEIAACRSLPCGDLPDERKDFFEKTVLNVEPHMSDEQILYVIEDTLDNPDALRRLTTNAYDLTMATSTMGVYAARFVDAVTELYRDWL